jgi:hypothetical protein
VMIIALWFCLCGVCLFALCFACMLGGEVTSIQICMYMREVFGSVFVMGTLYLMGGISLRGGGFHT